MTYDKDYLKKVQEEGLRIRLYARYVDDSNQIVESQDEDEEMIAGKLMQISNNILDGIEMECDMPSRHADKKLPILDMKCWIEEGVAYYMHYEKPVASKLLIPQRSAHSNNSKRSVHISELVRRCLNTSRRLG